MPNKTTVDKVGKTGEAAAAWFDPDRPDDDATLGELVWLRCVQDEHTRPLPRTAATHSGVAWIAEPEPEPEPEPESTETLDPAEVPTR